MLLKINLKDNDFLEHIYDYFIFERKTIMGKGDKKSRRGKIAKGTYGVTRPRSANKKMAEQPGKKTSKKK
ncbi:30S ribosomal protein THX [Ekhidna sp.]|uniref:30S ribosomal protein THX n=1 Tax=Ekhidna sp. TaxID=2608089 RepID=UPI003C7CAF03